MNEINKQLKLLHNEDIIWVIYLFIIVLAIYTNKLERDNIYNKNKELKNKANKINTSILIIIFLIYIYFANISYQTYLNAKTEKNKNIAIGRLIVSLVFLIGGALAIKADYDSNINNLDIAIF